MSRERGTGAEIIHNVTTGKRENSFIHETTKWQWPWTFFSVQFSGTHGNAGGQKLMSPKAIFADLFVQGRAKAS